MLKFTKTKKSRSSTEDAPKITGPTNVRNTVSVLDSGDEIHVVHNIPHTISKQELLDEYRRTGESWEVIIQRLSENQQKEKERRTTADSFPSDISSPISPGFSPVRYERTLKWDRHRDTWSILDNPNNTLPPNFSPQIPQSPIPGSAPGTLRKEKSRSIENETYMRIDEHPPRREPPPVPPRLENIGVEGMHSDENPYEKLPPCDQKLVIGPIQPTVPLPARPAPLPSPVLKLDYTHVQSVSYCPRQESPEEIRRYVDDIDSFLKETYLKEMVQEEVTKLLGDTEKRIEEKAAKIAKAETMNTIRLELEGRKSRPSLNLMDMKNGEQRSPVFTSPLPDDPKIVPGPKFLRRQSTEDMVDMRF